jgi:hypothetical protein
MVTKRKIDQIGDLLKKQRSLNQDDLETLLAWRNSFSPILEYYHNKLKAYLDEEQLIVLARRLKRIESIQIKLKRFKTMRLSTIQDIAGVRAVFKNPTALIEAHRRLRSQSTRNKLKRLDDYHSTPKSDGYRSMHLVYQNAQSTLIEIQLRTELEHIWATAVEIYGQLQETSFKTGEGETQWKDFFLLLSSFFAIRENCIPPKIYEKHSEKQIVSKLKKTIRKLQVIERLNAATNGIEVVVSKFNATGKTGKYAILELNLKDQTTRVEIFNKKDLDIAIKIYTERELALKKGEQKNIVFVNIEDLEKIQQSYPNYFLDTQKLLEILSNIILNQY